MHHERTRIVTSPKLEADKGSRRCNAFHSSTWGPAIRYVDKREVRRHQGHQQHPWQSVYVSRRHRFPHRRRRHRHRPHDGHVPREIRKIIIDIFAASYERIFDADRRPRILSETIRHAKVDPLHLSISRCTDGSIGENLQKELQTVRWSTKVRVRNSQSRPIRLCRFSQLITRINEDFPIEKKSLNLAWLLEMSTKFVLSVRKSYERS